MNRILATLLFACLSATTACGGPQDESASAESGLTGDLNGDRQTNIIDLQCMVLTQKWAILKNGTPPPACLQSRREADLNCDHLINVADVQILSILTNGKKLSSALDANGNGKVDACEMKRRIKVHAYGDVDGNGRVDISDYQCLVMATQWAVGGSSTSVPACLADRGYADLDCDGAISVIDLMVMNDVIFGQPLNPTIDANADGMHDSCQL